jgi:predicted RNA-binding protein YlxR (DUF448 family)
MPPNIPIRMCVICRKRSQKSELIRFWCIDGELLFYSKSGRSSYICTICKGSLSSKKKLNKKYINIDFEEMFG